MIPKIIHYCWFGGKPLPKSAIKCINSWKKFFPDYEIKEWNESNFDVNMMPFTREAYDAKKFAFVSDVARFWILYKEGGIYFDTDVEVIASMDDIVERGPFMGIEKMNVFEKGWPAVAPGLGLGTEAGDVFYREMLEHYRDSHYSDGEGNQLPGTVVMHCSQMLRKRGLQPTDQLQQVAGIWIYPSDYFCPLNDITGVLTKTNNTRTIHWYSKTWNDKPMIYYKITRILHRIFGETIFSQMKGKKT
jgi:mannosyltransferase OCH1-like enzyme